MNLAIFDSLLSLIDKILPDGTTKLQVKLAIEEARSKLKQPLAMSIFSIAVLLIYQGKCITYRLMKIVYFNTVEFWVDVFLIAAVISFLFGIPFKDWVKAVFEGIDKYTLNKKTS